MDSINTVNQINEDSKQEISDDDDQSTSSSQIVCGGCRKKLWSVSDELLTRNCRASVIIDLLRLYGVKL